MIITSKTKLICLLGHPVSHSKSPLMHNSILDEKSIDAKYFAFDVEPSKLGEAINGLKALNFLGANVTIPHKENVINYVDALTEEARNIGAVNTLYMRDGELVGDNTDGKGFMLSLLKDGAFEATNKKVLILGAGGASKAVSTKLCLENIKEISIYDINEEKLSNLVAHLISLKTSVKINLISSKELKDFASRSDLIVNCTPIGMKEGDPILLPEDVFNKKQLVFDLIYNPKKTKLLEFAEEKGAKIINGAGMLVYQGAYSFKTWTGGEANIQKMFEALGI